MVLLISVSCGIGGDFILESRCLAAPPSQTTPDTRRGSDAKWALPFSATDVVEYFTKALDVPPRQGEPGTTIFESSGGTVPENRYKIIVAQEERDVVVSFTVVGAIGMNVVREFFESPPFTRKESEQLYRLLDNAEGAPTLKLERFSVSARAWETRDSVHIVLRFFHPDGRVRLKRE
jgi:hypothetical protein